MTKYKTFKARFGNLRGMTKVPNQLAGEILEDIYLTTGVRPKSSRITLSYLENSQTPQSLYFDYGGKRHECWFAAPRSPTPTTH